jgi:hypothetical protein
MSQAGRAFNEKNDENLRAHSYYPLSFQNQIKFHYAFLFGQDVRS